MSSPFKLKTSLTPRGDQPKAISKLLEGLDRGYKRQTLLGVTGSGKTFSIANVVERWGRPTLILSHNKTLAAQLYGELASLFPDNAVEYFVSYYDYYQPEAYIPTTDTYIEKEATINEEIDKLRLRATSSLLSRDDTIVVASVSSIYTLGDPRKYRENTATIEVNREYPLRELIKKLVSIQYTRNDFALKRGCFRVRGDIVEIVPAYLEDAIRVEYFGDTIENMKLIDALTGDIKGRMKWFTIYPATHFVTERPTLERAIDDILDELEERLEYFEKNNKLLEAQRLKQRTLYDVEFMREMGYCHGIENYSRHISGREPGERPTVLLDYFPDDFLMIIDESHVTLPQVRGMYNGDRSRKETLVEHGFRLPSAFDNRPLRYEEFTELIGKTIFVSATPGDYELEISDSVVEQINRPTGLVDPEIVLKDANTQIDDLLNELNEVIKRDERALVTTLTKKMAEDLSEFLIKVGVKAEYLHSEIDTIDRVQILRNLRLGKFDVLVGINLLREGLDLPEVSLVAILDADKEGFLRNERSLIQTAGRAARNVRGKVILYAHNITGSIKSAMGESNRRRKIQLEFNEKHDITPKSIVKSTDEVLGATTVADTPEEIVLGVGEFEREESDPMDIIMDEIKAEMRDDISDLEDLSEVDVEGKVRKRIEEKMWEEAEEMRFEKAIVMRDLLEDMEGEEKPE